MIDDNLKKSDEENSSQFGEIEIFKGTNYWFKRDIQTIKKSLKVLPRSVLNAFLFTVAIILLSNILATNKNGGLALTDLLLFFVVMFPISLLGSFFITILNTKGYKIDPYLGTTIDSKNKLNRLSVSDILRSDISKKEKFIYFLRYLYYFAIVILFFVNIFYMSK